MFTSQLDLSKNQLCGLDSIGRGTYTAEGITAIADALKVTASVTKILVSRNKLGDEGATILCNALRESTVTKVEELDLSYNDIGPDGAKAIAALCAVCASITSVRSPAHRTPLICSTCSLNSESILSHMLAVGPLLEQHRGP